MEHKDERLLVSEGADWRDTLARLRDRLERDDEPGDEGEGTPSPGHPT